MCDVRGLVFRYTPIRSRSSISSHKKTAPRDRRLRMTIGRDGFWDSASTFRMLQFQVFVQRGAECADAPVVPGLAGHAVENGRDDEAVSGIRETHR